MLTSCGVSKYMLPGYRAVTDYTEQMELVSASFPEIYRLYQNGEVVISEVYVYNDRDGMPRVHIDYHYRNRY